MLTTRGLSPRYVRDLLTRAHQLLRLLADGATIGQLFKRLEIEGYNRHSMPDLESFLLQCPATFRAVEDHWLPVSDHVPEVVELGIDEPSLGPRKFESPRGSVWHLSRECEWLWEGKRKAAEDGQQRYRIQIVDVSERHPCRHCTRDVTYWPEQAKR